VEGLYSGDMNMSKEDRVMVQFIMCGGKATVVDSTIAEDGWIFAYDTEERVFLVWNSSERYAEGDFPDAECLSLEEVLRLVTSYT